MATARDQPVIHSVLGPVPSALFGPCLMHEHVLVDFIGASEFSRDRYDRRQVHTVILPHLLRIQRQGIKGFVECTPMYLGRDPLLLQGLAEASGLHIVTNTGLYAAGARENVSEPYLPAYAYELSADQLSGGWLKEWYEGIEGTKTRPGFLKIGVNRGPLVEISRTIVRAAARTSKQSGLAIAAHTASGPAALEILGILEEEGVAPDRYIFVHAQGEKDFRFHLECARLGAWIEYDGVRPRTSMENLILIRRLLDAGYESQILLSQDAGWYRPGEPEGGSVRGYDYLAGDFVSLLLNSEIPRPTVDHFLIHNPRRALEIG